jgi:hypothetical protein
MGLVDTNREIFTTQQFHDVFKVGACASGVERHDNTLAKIRSRNNSQQECDRVLGDSAMCMAGHL